MVLGPFSWPMLRAAAPTHFLRSNKMNQIRKDIEKALGVTQVPNEPLEDFARRVAIAASALSDDTYDSMVSQPLHVYLLKLIKKLNKKCPLPVKELGYHTVGCFDEQEI
jgi:hypothetical protein